MMAADLELYRSERYSELFPRNRRGRVKPCPHCQKRQRTWITAIITVLALAAGIAAAWIVSPQTPYIGAAPQRATLMSYSSYSEYTGARMLDWAEAHALNHQYAWGGTGPSSYDCSGLVFAAATAAGERSWPRDTYDIAHLIGSRFSITYHPQRGDLALWGPVSAPFHVELVTIWSQTTFGAETYGWAGRVTWHYDGWFKPSFYLHINW